MCSETSFTHRVKDCDEQKNGVKGNFHRTNYVSNCTQPDHVTIFGFFLSHFLGRDVDFCNSSYNNILLGKNNQPRSLR